MDVFVNTWSVEGFLSEGMQPAELGWGTHEKWMPENGRHPRRSAARPAIYLLQPGANTRVRSWCPTPGAQYGFLVTHNESISIADYFTVREGGKAVYRPTCHYAYHPANDAVLSLHELFGRAGVMQDEHHILDENEIVDGIDELGVLLYGHAKNAYWYGSQLSIEETRDLAPYQNATGLQVTSAVLAGMVWALENPTPASSRPTRWTTAAASKCSAPISARSTASTPTGRRSPTARASSPRTSTRATPGSSGTCWCGKASEPRRADQSAALSAMHVTYGERRTASTVCARAPWRLWMTIRLIALRHPRSRSPPPPPPTISTAQLGAGGLELVRNDTIEVLSEDLYVSANEVRVTYHFRNRTDAPVTYPRRLPAADDRRDRARSDERHAARRATRRTSSTSP